ncbi:MAG: topology modulation protein [Erythrobacter sp.]|nr:topology modulation protein [Erythrobacter sp.]RZV32789.1 MAG: topology modulation protein [Sphingomonadaceae bacterium]
MVIGPCGAGKSAASRRIAAALDLPLYHLDRLHWQAGWQEGTMDDLRRALAPILADERWLIDENYGSTLTLRLARADCVVYLDFSVKLCLWRAARRLWHFRGRTRPDMADDCPERLDLAFFHFIARWNQDVRPGVELRLAQSTAQVLRFSGPRELENWLVQLETRHADV